MASVGLTPQTSQAVERQVQAEIAAMETLVETPGLPGKKKALDQVRRQLASLSALVDFWWQEMWRDVKQQVALTPRWTTWIGELLLPLRSWQEQRSRTRCPQQKAKLLQALAAAQKALETHAITQQPAPAVLADWQVWATEHARAFQRASSAVEGRNGYLSPRHHHHRGLPKRRDKVWAVLHTCDGRAADGTTPAARFFRRACPDLFETVLSTIDDLPRPRQRNQALAISA